MNSSCDMTIKTTNLRSSQKVPSNKQVNITTRIHNQLKPISSLKGSIKGSVKNIDELKGDNISNINANISNNNNITPLLTNPNLEEEDITLEKKPDNGAKLKPIINSIKMISKLKSKSKGKSLKRKEYEFKLRPDMTTEEKTTEIVNLKTSIESLCKELSPKTVDSLKFLILKYWKYIVKILLSINIKLGLNGFKVLGDLLLEFDMYESAKSTFFFYVKYLV